MRQLKLLVFLGALVALDLARAAGPVTIANMIHCSDYGGVAAYALRDGTNAFLYDTTDQYSKNMQATMLATWVSGKTIHSYQVTSTCGVN